MKMITRIVSFLLLITTSVYAQVSTNAPDDGTLANLTNGMTEAQIQTVLGVAGRPRENAPIFEQILEYDFNGLSVWVEFALTGDGKTLRATMIRPCKDGLSIAERNQIRRKKLSEWVAAHQRNTTNSTPNQAMHQRPPLDP